MSWEQFLKLHWEVLAATDFFTVEVATWHGLITYYLISAEPGVGRQSGGVIYRERLGGLLTYYYREAA